MKMIMFQQKLFNKFCEFGSDCMLKEKRNSMLKTGFLV